MSGGRYLKPISDAAEIDYRVNSILTGCWITLAACCCVLVYYAAAPHGPHRMTSVFILLGTCAMVTAFLVLPLRPLMASRLRELFFMSWSLVTVIVVGTIVALDSSPHSPLILTFFLPLLYAGMSYPRWLAGLVGVLSVAAYLIDAALLDVHVADAVFASLALLLAAVMCVWQAAHRERQRDQLRQQRDELERVSRADPLTGCLNRRGFEERLSDELAAATRNGTPLALALLDLDDFKAVNDRDGHAAGDALLRLTVHKLQEMLRPTDVVGRQGGDEFAVTMPGASASDAQQVVERVAQVLGEITPASIGLACFPEHGRTLEELTHHADAQLYAAKHGRGLGASGRRELSWATALADAVDRRMDLEHEHSRSVADLAAAMAERLGWTVTECGLLRLAAILHDVGKVSIPDRILCKPSALTEEEYEQMKGHSATGAQIVSRIDGMTSVVPWIRHSHEHLDGSGYPDGLAGEAIPQASRILLVADAFDAMTSDRPYRAAMPTLEAIRELRVNAGRQFDPVCVEVLAALIEHQQPAAARD